MSQTCPLCDREPDSVYVHAHHRYEVWCPWMSCPCDLRGVGQSESEALAEWDEQVSAVVRSVRVNLKVQGPPVQGEFNLTVPKCLLWRDGDREAHVTDETTVAELVGLARERILKLRLGPEQAAGVLHSVLTILGERERRRVANGGVPETESSGAVTKVERL